MADGLKIERSIDKKGGGFIGQLQTQIGINGLPAVC